MNEAEVFGEYHIDIVLCTKAGMIFEPIRCYPITKDGKQYYHIQPPCDYDGGYIIIGIGPDKDATNE